MRYNLDSKVNGIQSSRMRVPDWAGRATELLPSSAGTLLDKATNLDQDTLRIRGLSVSSQSSSFEPSGLMNSKLYDEPITLDNTQLMNWARRTTPVEDEPDVTDWMVPAKAAIAHLRARSREYGRAGSSLTVASGDPLTPGVHNGQMSFLSERGDTVSDRGTGKIKLSSGNVREFEVPGNETIVEPNLLGWAAGYELLEKQWIGSLLSVEELTNNPSSPIGFPNLRGNTGPLFVGHNPSRPSIINRVSATFQSDSAQTVNFKLRDTRDYTRVINTFSKDIPKGESTLNFRVLALGINPMVAEIQPEDGTKTVLKNYSVNP